MDSQQGCELTHHFIEIDVKSAKEGFKTAGRNSGNSHAAALLDHVG